MFRVRFKTCGKIESWRAIGPDWTAAEDHIMEGSGAFDWCHAGLL